ncbi:MAG: FadR family transcriptional regulator [Deltaproteobacteria bacterium]|nr:FadR family transcriptional regulator [Deltaproteobacteria bacterium]
MATMEKIQSRQKVAEEVADHLRDSILKGQYQAGDKLPPERALAQQLGVNRASLREALKSLEHGGLVRIRQGDGTRVLDFLHTAGLDLLTYLAPLPSGGVKVVKDILEFRQILGRELARLAAERATEDQLESLRAIAARRPTDPVGVLHQDIDFYCELSRVGGNLVFTLLLNSVRALVNQFSGLLTDVNAAPEQIWRHQEQIVAAVAKGDGQGAWSAADQQLQRGKEHLLAKWGPVPEVRVAMPPHETAG